MKTSFTQKTIFLLPVLTLLFILPTKAQMVIKEDGRVIIGPDTRPNDDGGHVLSMTIHGTCGEMAEGAKIGFGDFGSYSHNGWNVFVGEFGRHDSDILWLHGKNGIKTTRKNGSTLISEWDEMDGISRYAFYDGVRADRLTLSCDDNHKSDIATISPAFSKLFRLRGVEYDYNPIGGSVDVGEEENRTDSVGNSEDVDGSSDNIQGTRNSEARRYGFVTSELAELFPELVDIDANGNQYVNYVELIPIIVNAIREMYVTLASAIVASRGDDTEEQVYGETSNAPTAGSMLHGTGQSGAMASDGAVLYRNTPNQFTNSTKIAYYIPTGATDAEIYIFGLGGELLKTYPIDAFGNGSVTISGSTFTAGMYIYTLVVDGNIIDNKRMILTR